MTKDKQVSKAPDKEGLAKQLGFTEYDSEKVYWELRAELANDAWHKWIDEAPIEKIINDHLTYGITDVEEDPNVTIVNITRSDHQDLARSIRKLLKGKHDSRPRRTGNSIEENRD